MIDDLPQISRRDAVKACAALAVSTALGAPLTTRAAEIGAGENAASSAKGLHQILRIHLPLEVAARRTAEVLDYCKRTGCSEVLLFTSSYDHAPSFQSLEQIR